LSNCQRVQVSTDATRRDGWGLTVAKYRDPVHPPQDLATAQVPALQLPGIREQGILPAAPACRTHTARWYGPVEQHRCIHLVHQRPLCVGVTRNGDSQLSDMIPYRSVWRPNVLDISRRDLTRHDPLALVAHEGLHLQPSRPDSSNRHGSLVPQPPSRSSS
jgi:hypothetical protein